jgi:hypothetical protein
MWNFSDSSPITRQTFLVMSLYSFLVDRKRSVEGARHLEADVVKLEGVLVVLQTVDDSVWEIIGG